MSKHRYVLSDQLGERGYARVHFAAEAGRYAVTANRPAGNEPKPKVIRNIRDETMAEVVDWILDQHGDQSRIMLWAHDGHVTKYRGDPQKDWPFLGSFLEAKYGDDYIPVGFSFAKGGFQALYWPKPGEDWARRVLDEYQIEGVIPESIDHLLSEVGHDLFFLDLRTSSDDQVPSWLTQPRTRRSIGGLFDKEDAEGPRFTKQVVLPEHFEMMVFVNKTTRAVPLTPPARFLFGAWTKDGEDGGALVTGVGADSIAQRAGIQTDDIIRRIGNFKVENTQDLNLALSKLDQPGKIAVQILRRQKDGSLEPKTQYIQVPEWVSEH
jgi:erythromycin esterase